MNPRFQHHWHGGSWLGLLLGVVSVSYPGGGEVVANSSCRYGARSIRTPKMQYCVCNGDLLCTGTMCKRGLHKGKVMHGYPQGCSDCECSRISDGSGATSSDRGKPLTPIANRPEDLRIIFIKSYKVASTTIAAIFQRISEERGLKAASRYNAGMPMLGSQAGAFQMVYGHNFYSMGSKAGFPCQVKLVDNEWTYCGGYQVWMDHYVQNAHHLIMIAEPVERIASMYYYEAGYTKQKDRAPEDTVYKRINTDPRFSDPSGADETHIARFLEDSEFYNKWERVQWWWIRDITANKTVSEATAVLRDRFTVGIPSRLDETLLIWKKVMHLETRDIIYTSMKSSLSHPKATAWSENNIARAEELCKRNGDAEYFAAAQALYANQVEDYGASTLAKDLSSFRTLLTNLRSRCSHLVVTNEMLHVPDQVYCMLKYYDKAYENAHAVTEDLGCHSSLQTEQGRMRQMLFASDLTLSACVRRCRKGLGQVGSGSRFTYAALAFGTHCYCGVAAPVAKAKVSNDICDTPCSGNSLKTCGGTAGYSFHRIIERGADWVDPIIAYDDVQ